MNKKLLLAMFVVAVITAFCFSYGDYREEKNAFTDEKAIAEKECSYEIFTEGNEIVVYELKGNEKTVIKRDLYMPARENDLLRLRDGIECESKEEALKIFEDFVS